MPKRIKKDQQRFREIISGKFRKELSKLVKTGGFTKLRPDKKGRLIVPTPKIDIPHIVYGDNGKGVGRGPAKKGDVIGRDPSKGDGEGQGQQAGTDPKDFINIAVDLEDFLRFLERDLQLPPMRPKPTPTYDEVKKIYNNLSKVGPRSLRHVRQTFKQAMKRLAATNQLGKLYEIPGFSKPIPMIPVINDDFRYRQYTEKRIPTSDAVIFFARDCSASMDQIRCDIVSDMSWWIDCWIRRYYKKVQRVYYIHDTEATEVDEKSFYTMRYGGGTEASSVFKSIASTFDNRFPPSKYNIYIFYFGDGGNFPNDNSAFLDVMIKKFGKEVVNLIGYVQVLTYDYDSSLKNYLEQKLSLKNLSTINYKSSSIGPEESSRFGGYYASPTLTEEERDKEIVRAIKDILGGPVEV